MSLSSHLTVKDYLHHALWGGITDRKPYSPAEATVDGSRVFYQILTSFETRQKNASDIRPTGMTIADYRRAPVRLCGQIQQQSEKPSEEQKAVKSPAAKTAAKSSTAETQSGRQDSPVAISSNRQTASNESQIIENSIFKAAGKYDLPPGLIRAVIRAESNFQVDAVSRAGAQGLMQLMPETARQLGVANPFDIEQNIDGGARYLRLMLDNFGGDVKVALAAYNAGPGAVEKYGGRIPPYQETEQYVDRVLRFSKQMA